MFSKVKNEYLYMIKMRLISIQFTAKCHRNELLRDFRRHPREMSTKQPSLIYDVLLSDKAATRAGCAGQGLAVRGLM